MGGGREGEKCSYGLLDLLCKFYMYFAPLTPPYTHRRYLLVIIIVTGNIYMALTPCHVVFSALHLQTSQEPSKKTTIIICILQYQEFVSQKGYIF